MKKHKFQDSDLTGRGFCNYYEVERTSHATTSSYPCAQGPDHSIHEEHCNHCGGSGILNVEAIDVDQMQYAEPLETYWVPVASWCHGCENGLLWKDLL